MPPKPVQLPAKEKGLFARLIQEYESRKYKPALKSADAILKRVPYHAETLAIKGLVLASMHRRAEGLKLAKESLRLNLMSFICWHTLGIIHRMERNYEESLKCYTQALRIEGGNINLVRESAYMYMQLRQYAPLIEARLSLLRVQPYLRVNWIGLAVAHDVAGSKKQAARVLAAYESAVRDLLPHDYEFSEVVLYHVSILLQLDESAEALALLDAKKDVLYDRPAQDAMRAAALEKMGRIADADAVLYALVEWNPENKNTVRSLLALRTAHAEDSAAASLAHLATLQAAFPRSSAMQRLALDFAQGDAFTQCARAYIESALVKNIPSLFSDVKPLYKDAAKQHAIERIVASFLAANEPASGALPSNFLWAMSFMAYHYSYTGAHAKALQYIDSILVHTPTMPELHMTRARILKRAGALHAAADAMEDARLLDGQDRYLNTKAAKYLLRVNRIAEATKIMQCFTRQDASDPIADLVDMQATGYLVEDADAHRRSGNDALALKRYVQVDRILQDIYDDQLDFHSYCMRKMTLRSYADTVRFEDSLFSQPIYSRAATGAIGMYVKLHDRNVAGAPVPVQEAQEAQKAQEAQEAEDIDEDHPPKDTDPNGILLAATHTPLLDAHAYITKLQSAAPHAITTWLSTLDVALREQKWMLALRAFAMAHALDSADPQLHVRLLQFRQVALPENVQRAVDRLARHIPALAQPLDTVQTEYLQRDATTASRLLGAAQGIYTLKGTDGIPEAAHLVLGMTRPAMHASFAELGEAQAFLHQMQSRGALPCDADISTFQASACALWPMADAFQPAAALQRAAEDRALQRRAWYTPT
ncbi:hypothetical protein MVES1_003365 [Malassezia vespertilionis]|uniref:Nat1p n=1 Tax=Malassezia vespertilionis TaxID=2020962 RepID=A0A2N1J787_9BASI|nr:uncharacterized protein MVES1_003365 [Malassezia vespertilionis]PKI82411.1 hypothetical protein MVES_003606 [Malassezia vespertilionis]WFD07996.1 hypothetical protein MVES1_003365 [Malassezia vespertilionis]